MKTLQQVANLSDGTIANCIRQAQDDKAIFFGFDSTEHDVTTKVQRELYQYTKRNDGKYLTWVDAFINFNKEIKTVVQQELFDYCKDHAKHYGGMPMDFEIEICGMSCIYPFEQFERVLSADQFTELNSYLTN